MDCCVFNLIAYTNDGVIKAIMHKKFPWLGVTMWHPEREPCYDYKTIDFLKNC